MQILVGNIANPFFTEDEIVEFGIFIAEELVNSTQRKKKFESLQNMAQGHDGEDLILTKDVAEINFCYEYVDLLGKLFSVHQEKSLKCLPVAYEIIRIYAGREEQRMEHKLGLTLACDVITELGHLPLVKEQYSGKILKIFLQSAYHPLLQTRNHSYFGIGACAEIMGQLFFEYYDLCIMNLKNAKDYEVQNLADRNFYRDNLDSLEDNRVSAIGKILKCVVENMIEKGKRESFKEDVDIWVEYLPIRVDIGESKISCRILREFLESWPDLVIFGDQEMMIRRVLKVLQICAFVNKKSEEMIEKEDLIGLSKIMITWWRKMKSIQIFKDEVSSLSSKVRQQLKLFLLLQGEYQNDINDFFNLSEEIRVVE